MYHSQRFVLPLLTLLASCLIPVISHANTINMYDAPKADAKISGTIDLSAGIIPIYSPKNSDWIKVADPRNGNTGWVKNSEIKDSKGNVITFSQQYSQDGKQGSSMQMMQIGNQTMTPEQRKAAEQNLKSAQESLIKQQENLSQSIVNLNKVYEQAVENMRQTGVTVRPIITPEQLNINGPSSSVKTPGNDE